MLIMKPSVIVQFTKNQQIDFEEKSKKIKNVPKHTTNVPYFVIKQLRQWALANDNFWDWI